MPSRAKRSRTATFSIRINETIILSRWQDSVKTPPSLLAGAAADARSRFEPRAGWPRNVGWADPLEQTRPSHYGPADCRRHPNDSQTTAPLKQS